MYVTLTHVCVKPEHVESFIVATRLYHATAINDTGTLRLDLLQDAEAPENFVLYRDYASAEDARAHKDTEHHREWHDTVTEMMAEPRQSDSYNAICQ